MSRSLAVGVACAFSPIPGLQTPLLIVLVWITKSSLPIAYAAHWINNPITLIPVAIFEYKTGQWLLGQSHSSQLGLFQDWLSHPTLSGITGEMVISVFWPYCIGCALWMVILSIVTYVIGYIFWSWRVSFKAKV